MPIGLYLGTRQFANAFLGSGSVDEIYLGPDLVWARYTTLPIGSDTMFLGNMAATYSGRDMLALDLNITPANNIVFYRELAGNVYASSSVNYDIPAGTFDNNATLTSYIDGGRCKAISASAFQYCFNIETASFTSASVLKNNAFYASQNLKTISFPNAVTVGDYAFDSCTQITEAVFPKATTIGTASFEYMYSLATASFPLVTNIPQGAFNTCQALVTASFPSATVIGNTAFSQCISLVTASFPLVTIVEEYAFYGCNRLALPPTQSVTFIGTASFQNCSLRLTNASFPAATIIGTNAFAGCTALVTASFPNVTVIGRNAFSTTSNLLTASFPSATTIGDQAFSRSGITKAIFPNVTYAGGYGTFQNCSNLISASFPQLTSVAASMFFNDFKLQYIYLPAVTASNLGTGAPFQSVPKTGSITVPVYYLTNNGGHPDTNLQYLHNHPRFDYDYAQYWNINYVTGSTIYLNKTGTPYTLGDIQNKLEGETLSNFVNSGTNYYMTSSTDYHVKMGAFQGITELTAYIDTGRCKAISGSAFQGTGLLTASFPGVVDIEGINAFSSIAVLEKANFPALKTMGNQAFSLTTALQTIDLPEVLNISQGAFNTSGLRSIAAPMAESIGIGAFSYCTNLGFNNTALKFPKVKTVGTQAFFLCPNLKYIYLPALSGSTALGGSTGNDLVFYNAAPSGYIEVPSYLSASNAGNPDGDLTYLQNTLGWQISYL